MTKAYVLITRYFNSPPEIELYSKLPTFDMTTFDATTLDPTNQGHCYLVTSYELYEGSLDGGDTREIPIRKYFDCYGTYAATSTFTTNPADPTTAYRLTCGHSTIDA